MMQLSTSLTACWQAEDELLAVQPAEQYAESLRPHADWMHEVQAGGAELIAAGLEQLDGDPEPLELLLPQATTKLRSADDSKVKRAIFFITPACR